MKTVKSVIVMLALALMTAGAANAQFGIDRAIRRGVQRGANGLWQLTFQIMLFLFVFRLSAEPKIKKTANTVFFTLTKI
ncbi:MAG: hypothetical protein LBV26_04960 [Bacteroidales bacterium]|jgi:hypothetical protein|nr:hypothetical protein [Bacteroidales bacterium]